MLDIPARRAAGERVVIVDGPRVVVIHQGARQVHAAQIAAVLVRHGVVGVVGARSEIAVGTQRPARHRQAGGGAVQALPRLVYAGENVGQIAPGHPAPAPELVLHGHVLPDGEDLAGEVDEVVLGDVVAQRVKDLGGDQLRSGGHLGIRRRIELDEVPPPAAVEHDKSRGDALGLGGDHGPGAVHLGRRVLSRSGREFLQAHAPPVVPPLPPGAFHRVAERVDALGRDALARVLPFSRSGQRVPQDVVVVAQLSPHRLHRARRRLFDQRVVVVELPGGRAGGPQPEKHQDGGYLSHLSTTAAAFRSRTAVAETGR